MKKSLIMALCSLAMASCTTTTDLTRYVDPNLGCVHSRWFFYTPAARPFAMAKLGASTNGSYGNQGGWEAVGYDQRHQSIEGFACLHEFQVGGIMLMPTVGKLQTQPGLLDDPDSGYRSRFDHEDEYATAGYYSVKLKDYNILAELTATDRVGFQRYTFPESESSAIIFDVGSRLGESGEVVDAYIRMVDNHTVEGYVITEPTYVQKYQPGATVAMYFYAVSDSQADRMVTFHRGEEPCEQSVCSGKGACGALMFKTKEGQQTEVKIGLSYTSIANAKANLLAEASDVSFDKAKKEAHQTWQQMLGRVMVEGGTEADRTKFYTGLYHALLGRGLASDVNGAYPRNDGTIGHIALENGRPIHNHYNTDAVWGAYWNLTQLWSLAYPEYYSDFIKSQLLVYDQTGWLGDGIATSKYVSGVGTNMMSIVFAGAYNWGIRDFDIDKAYAAALKNETQSFGRLEGAGKMDVGQFVALGYSPYDESVFYGTHSGGSQFSASHTLEYSFSSHATGQWASELGKADDAALLNRLADGWKLLYHTESGYIRPRTADGNFIDNFDPLQSWRGFQEGNAMQYTFFVPQAPRELIAMVGEEKFNARLDSIFTQARETGFGGGKTIDAFSGLQSPYNHGNQPSLHISWLFNYSHKPFLTQKWTRLICDEFYGTEAEHGYGYGQDEDQGQLGAWYVMAAMGLFDVQGGSDSNPEFQIGSPHFDKITIKLGKQNSSGSKFVIQTENNSDRNIYVQSAQLNGQPFNSCSLASEELHKGGKLTVVMGSQPNTDWGAK